MLVVTVVMMAVQLAGRLHASPLATAHNTTVGEMTLNPMTSSPQLTFTTTGQEDSDRKEPDYIAIASTADGNHLIMVDRPNKKVKVMTTSSGTPRVTSSVELSKDLWDIAILPDGMVAVTTYLNNYIYLLRLQGDVITFTSHFQTGKKYDGIAAGLDNNTLLVTARKYLDVITRQGQVVESFYIEPLIFPDYLCRAGGDDVIVSDWAREVLFRVNARTGELKETLSHPDMETPHQAAVDKGGNVYVASRGSNRVMVMSPDGEWRTLLQDNNELLPTGISVTADDVIVSWSNITIHPLRFWSEIKSYTMTDDVI